MEAKIVFSGISKKGRKIIIRYPQENDLKEMWRYINTLSQERTFVRFQGEEISLAEEDKFLKDLLKILKRRRILRY